MADTVPAMLEPGEFVIRRDAAQKIGQPALHALNNFDKNQGSHGAIDELIALGTLGMQEGGEVGLQHAKDYEYSPNTLEKMLDVLPFVGGKRAYDRAEEYRKGVHWNPEDVEFREAQDHRSMQAKGRQSRFQQEDMDTSTADKWQHRALTYASEDPRSFSYRNVAEDDDMGIVDQFVIGSPSGHIMMTDDTTDYSVDPHNIVKSSKEYKGLAGLLGIPKYSGSIKKNPGINPYIDKEYFEEQIAQTDAQKFQHGGNVNDPLEIDKRMADPSIYEGGNTLGVVDEDATLMSQLKGMQGDINLLQLQKDMHYPNPNMFNRYRSLKENAGDIMTQEEMMGVLSKAAKRTQGMFKPKGYQDGGNVYEYGDSESGVPSLDDIYRSAGIEPNKDNTDRFQEYDVSREETRVDDYYGNLESVRRSGGAKAGKAREAAQGAGKGFAGMGARSAGVEDTLGDLMGAQERAGEKEYRGLFEDIRGMREDYMKDMTSQLWTLEGTEGTQKYNAGGEGIVGAGVDGSAMENLPDFETVTTLPTSNQGMVYMNGDFYIWSEEEGKYVPQE